MIYKLAVVKLQEAFPKLSHTPTDLNSGLGRCSFELPKYLSKDYLFFLLNCDKLFRALFLVSYLVIEYVASSN